ncbi:hypothetical protein AMURIS_05157 [Acetatifactor muris]|uniref:Uncharacterized protein n=1 Tax=Acetatifactor muris TaxID=879566 RepID=A0A2K4ZPH4_9FIRM|nr:hypothetical protein AMURIS_05157 [Acetatifactor muris]
MDSYNRNLIIESSLGFYYRILIIENAKQFL